MSYLREIPITLKHIYYTLRKGYRQFARDYFIVVIKSLLRIRKVNKEMSTNIAKQKIYVPNNYIAFLVLQEIFVYDLYKQLHGLKHVLDLGGYIGDSALYLSKYNDQVTVVESDPRNFQYLEKNLHTIPNVKYHHKAVVTDPNKEFFILKDNEYRGTVSAQKSTKHDSIRIPIITIQDLMKDNNFDGLKMDIEGGEYPIIEYFMNSNDFPFHKGFIEFHFTDDENQTHKQTVKKFLIFLAGKGYTYDIFDNANHIQRTSDFVQNLSNTHYQQTFVNIYFQKIN